MCPEGEILCFTEGLLLISSLPPSTPPHLKPSQLSEVSRSSLIPLAWRHCSQRKKNMLCTRRILNDPLCAVILVTKKDVKKKTHTLYKWHVFLIFCIRSILVLNLHSNDWASLFKLKENKEGKIYVCPVTDKRFLYHSRKI